MMSRYAKSKALHERASRVLVGGVNSPVRSFKRVGRHPVLARRGSGAYIEDVDGNRYIDFVMSYGPHLYGHAHPAIVEAVTRAAAGSSCLGMTSEGECEWAEKALARIPGAEKIRAVSSGTEACATAVRLARGITGRDVIVKFSGHYHGHVDSLLMEAGSGVATLSELSVPECAGIPLALAGIARVLRFNDISGAEQLFATEGNQIAGVILEPIMGNMGVVPPEPAFLKALRELCTKYGALLIFDEVMTGFRVHEHSAQGRFGLSPDLSTFGKVVGGGLPLAAIAGPAQYMDHLAPLGPVYQAGTLSGNPIAVAAGIAMLDLLNRENPYALLETTAAKIESVFREAATEVGIPLRIERVGAMLSFFFRAAPVRNDLDARAVDMETFGRFFWAMLDAGIMMPPSPFEALFVATAHAQLNWDEFSEKVRGVFRTVRG
jgi:glutamate-1-semialdehyde 2,1-aminomutase